MLEEEEGVGPRKANFSEVKVRRALAYCDDYQSRDQCGVHRHKIDKLIHQLILSTPQTAKLGDDRICKGLWHSPIVKDVELH
ncbi:hypothetical protein RugamoR64_37890 [Duganella rhizosphaerae]|uniref:hypothetical protein n=1 Tax=Duganella rhizosphaerae TaxID=2885763 RepID=UPI0030EA4A3C